LKGVNDDALVLDALFRQLVTLRVRPYYLHHPDLAPGTSHFRVPIEAGQELMRRLRACASGLCLPTYVLDIPGGFGKVPIGPTYVGARRLSGGREVIDNGGTVRAYPE
jgi:lysine 2,3-aminomutase